MIIKTTYKIYTSFRAKKNKSIIDEGETKWIKIDELKEELLRCRSKETIRQSIQAIALIDYLLNELDK